MTKQSVRNLMSNTLTLASYGYSRLEIDELIFKAHRRAQIKVAQCSRELSKREENELEKIDNTLVAIAGNHGHFVDFGYSFCVEITDDKNLVSGRIVLIGSME